MDVKGTPLVLSLDGCCTFFGRPKKVPKKGAATSEARGTAKGLLAPWNPKVEGRGRAGLKNRQDTFFDAPPTRSRLTAPPIKIAEVGFLPVCFSLMAGL